MGPHTDAAAPLPGGGGGPAANVTLAGAMDDARGLSIAVLQDHDGVRIDVAGIEIMLTRDAAYTLRALVRSATIDAADWEAAQETDDA